MDHEVDKLGIPFFTYENLIDIIYDDYEKVHTVLCKESTETKKFHQSLIETDHKGIIFYKTVNLEKGTFDDLLSSEWLIPNKYKTLDLTKYLLDKCTSDDQISRVNEELDAYKNHNLLDLLRSMVYIVDVMKENNIVWGVGRGSSVSSFVLFLIGIHKVDSLKYNLDWKEFLR